MPLALLLLLLSPLWLVIAAPSAALLLFSGDPEMAQLQKWYMAPILPVLFSAVVALLHRHSVQRARWLSIWLLISAVVGFLLFSPLPLGGRYDAALYDVTAHDRVARALMADISAEASVATQPHYVPHLAHREAIYHYPWVRPGVETLDVVLLDPQTNPYPFTNDELALEINRLLADPTVGISAEVAGIYLFSPNAPTPNRLLLDVAFTDGMQLVGLELAASDADGVLRPIDASHVVLTPGQQLRVGLIWEKVGDSAESPVSIPNDRNVSVRLAAADGYLHAQHDGTPANGLRPTTQWQPGEILRDVHTLTVPDGLPLDQLTLELVVYDWQTQETVLTTNGEERAVLAPIAIQR